MKKRQEAKYQKEVDEAMNKYVKLIHHHLGSVMQRFANEMFKINAKYFDMK